VNVTFRLVLTGLAVLAACYWFLEDRGAAAAAGGQQPAGAGAASAQAPYKIAVVNRKEAFDAYERQKTEWQRLEDEKNKRQADIDALSKKIEEDKKRYEAGTGMTQEQKDQLKEQIEADFRKYQNQFRDAQSEIDSKSRKFFAQMMEEIDQAIQEIGAQENYHLIMECDRKAATSVIYFSTTIDITPKVIAHLNRK
jgi:Skp family chaperone for outer membrane proteins